MGNEKMELLSIHDRSELENVVSETQSNVLENPIYNHKHNRPYFDFIFRKISDAACYHLGYDNTRSVVQACINSESELPIENTVFFNSAIIPLGTTHSGENLAHYSGVEMLMAKWIIDLKLGVNKTRNCFGKFLPMRYVGKGAPVRLGAFFKPTRIIGPFATIPIGNIIRIGRYSYESVLVADQFISTRFEFLITKTEDTRAEDIFFLVSN